MRSTTPGFPGQIRRIRGHPVVHGPRRRVLVANQLVQRLVIQEDLTTFVLTDRLARRRRRDRDEDDMAMGNGVSQVGHRLQDRSRALVERPPSGNGVRHLRDGHGRPDKPNQERTGTKRVATTASAMCDAQRSRRRARSPSRTKGHASRRIARSASGPWPRSWPTMAFQAGAASAPNAWPSGSRSRALV